VVVVGCEVVLNGVVDGAAVVVNDDVSTSNTESSLSLPSLAMILVSNSDLTVSCISSGLTSASPLSITSYSATTLPAENPVT